MHMVPEGILEPGTVLWALKCYAVIYYYCCYCQHFYFTREKMEAQIGGETCLTSHIQAVAELVFELGQCEFWVFLTSCPMNDEYFSSLYLLVQCMEQNRQRYPIRIC